MLRRGKQERAPSSSAQSEVVRRDSIVRLGIALLPLLLLCQEKGQMQAMPRTSSALLLSPVQANVAEFTGPRSLATIPERPAAPSIG